MQDTFRASIEPPTNPDYPPAADTLLINSLNGCPYKYCWILAKKVTNPDSSVSYPPLVQGSGAITDAQWAAWTTQPNDYILQCAAENLGVTIIPEAPAKRSIKKARR